MDTICEDEEGENRDYSMIEKQNSIFLSQTTDLKVSKKHIGVSIEPQGNRTQSTGYDLSAKAQASANHNEDTSRSKG